MSNPNQQQPGSNPSQKPQQQPSQGQQLPQSKDRPSSFDPSQKSSSKTGGMKDEADESCSSNDSSCGSKSSSDKR